MGSLLCHIASPTRQHYLGEIYYASIPGTEGGFGVLAGHQTSVVLNAAQGLVTIWLNEDGSSKEEFLVMEGLTKVFNNTVRILGRFCKNIKTLNRDELEEKIPDLESKIETYKLREDEMGAILLETSQEHLAWYQYQLDYLDSHR